MLLCKKIFESFFIPNIIVVVSLKMKIIKIIFYKNKFIDFLCFKGFVPSLADLKGMIIPPPAERGGMIIPLRSARGGMNIPLSLEESIKIYLMTGTGVDIPMLCHIVNNKGSMKLKRHD